MKPEYFAEEMEGFLQLGEAEQFDFLTVLALSSEKEDAKRGKENEIPGCQSGLWAEVLKMGEHVQVRCDSDSLLVKGMGLLIAGIFDGALSGEADRLACQAKAFLESDRNFMLDEDRRKGLKSMVDKILDTVKKEQSECCRDSRKELL